MDMRWASQKLGASELTVGRFGCTTTAIAMLSDYFKCYKSPLEIASVKKNYTLDGLILWPRLAFANMRWAYREYGRNDAEITAALKDPKRAVILQVNDGQHWVVATSKVPFFNDYWCADPIDGKNRRVLSRYKNITGASYFERK
jgi:hypothetical protein